MAKLIFFPFHNYSTNLQGIYVFSPRFKKVICLNSCCLWPPASTFLSQKHFYFLLRTFLFFFIQTLPFATQAVSSWPKPAAIRHFLSGFYLWLESQRDCPLGGSIPDQYKVLSMLESPAPLPSQLALVLPNPQPGSSASKKFCEVSVPSNKFPFA